MENAAKNQARIILLIALVLISIIPIARSIINPTMPGEASYYHQAIASAIFGHSDITKPAAITPYHLLLAVLSLAMPKAWLFLPIALSLLSVFLLVRLLQQTGISAFTLYTIAALYISSPLFLWHSAFSSPYTLYLVLVISGMLLLAKPAAAASLFIIALFFGIRESIVLLLVLLSVSFIVRRDSLKYLIMALAALTIALAFLLPVPPPVYDGAAANLLQATISDLGSTSGFSVFALVLAILGMVFLWKDKKKLAPVILLTVVLASFTTLMPFTQILLNILVAWFAGKAITHLYSRKWTLPLIKDLTLFVILLGILFSAVSFLVRASSADPSPAMIESLDWLRLHSNKGDVVLSHPKNGFWIQSVAQLQALQNNIPGQNRHVQEDMQQIFSGRDILKTRKLLAKYTIRYLWIDKSMKGMIWKTENQGLLSILKENEIFTKAYENPDVQIWMVRPQP